MVAHGARLAIDFGTFNTVALLRRAGAEPRPLLIDGSPLLPSAVFLEGPGDVLSGGDALRSARLHPERFEPNPKRRMADGLVLLGGHEVDIVDLVAAVLARVAAESRAVLGHEPDRLVVTHPEVWGTARLNRLVAATARAGLPAPRLVSEPVAAAAYFLDRSDPVDVGRSAVVYDFGAGTFDASVVRRDPDGALTVLASEGLPEVGGLDLDAAIVEHLGKLIAARDPAAWDRLRRPEHPGDRRARWQLWEDVRLAKETLSRRAQTFVHLPVVDDSVPVTREELDKLAEPIIARTVAVTRSAVRAAGIAADRIAGVYLVGGSSRVPLVATLLHRAFGIAPTALEQPQLVVAEGALRLLDAREVRTSTGVTIALPAGVEPAPRPPAATGRAPVTHVPVPVEPAPAPVRREPAGRGGPPVATTPRRAGRLRPHLADPWGIGAAVVFGGLGAAVAGATGSPARTTIAVGLAVALTVYAVRVILGVLFDR